MISLMSSLPSNLSTLGQVLKLTQAIMDKFLQVVRTSFKFELHNSNWLIDSILNASWTIVM